jgi:hypothetical protein
MGYLNTTKEKVDGDLKELLQINAVTCPPLGTAVPSESNGISIKIKEDHWKIEERFYLISNHSTTKK